MSAANGKADVMALLLEHGADLEAKDQVSVLGAAQCGNAALAEVLALSQHLVGSNCLSLQWCRRMAEAWRACAGGRAAGNCLAARSACSVGIAAGLWLCGAHEPASVFSMCSRSALVRRGSRSASRSSLAAGSGFTRVSKTVH